MTKKSHQKFWQMKRHIFGEKSHGKMSLAKFFLDSLKKFLKLGVNASLSQGGWTPLARARNCSASWLS